VEPVKLSDDFIALNDGFFTICAAEAAWSMERELREHRELLSAQFRRFLQAGQAAEPDTVQRIRAALMRSAIAINQTFDTFDALLTPAAPGEAEPGNAVGNNEFNRIWTMTHLPCLTIPGALGTSGMPVGIQLVGRRGADRLLLAVGKKIGATLVS
jgi:Asp-tRNA(Asn)/Glu-tRNA(Gln) amidotransferase A subunit family amidase